MTTHPPPTALLPRAEKALARWAGFAQAAMRLRYTLCIGTVLDPAFTRLGPVLQALVEATPQVRAELGMGFCIGLPDEFKQNQPLAQAFIGSDAMIFEVNPLVHLRCLVIAPPGWGPQVKGGVWGRLPDQVQARTSGAGQSGAPGLRALIPLAKVWRPWVGQIRANAASPCRPTPCRGVGAGRQFSPQPGDGRARGPNTGFQASAGSTIRLLGLLSTALTAAHPPPHDLTHPPH